MADWTDIQNNGWLNNLLPLWTRPYTQLMRLDRPIGTWLLLLPCWWSLALAGGDIPNIWLMLLFAIGAIVMRGAGCVVNDIYDRRLDAMVERTAVRPLASGALKLWQAFLLLALLLLFGLGILLLLNRTTVLIGLASLLLVFTYPLMKRITWWPQLFLGFTFNWGAWMGWSAVTGKIGLSALFLYAAGILWTLGYDTIYAHQDKRDDELVGIKSTARLFGDRSRPWVALFYTLALIFLMLAGWVNNLGSGFYMGLLIAAAFALVQLGTWKMDDPENCLQQFRRNRDFGLIVFAAIIIGKVL